MRVHAARYNAPFAAAAEAAEAEEERRLDGVLLLFRAACTRVRVPRVRCGDNRTPPPVTVTVKSVFWDVDVLFHLSPPCLLVSSAPPPRLISFRLKAWKFSSCCVCLFFNRRFIVVK